jgi:hypothetical protein
MGSEASGAFFTAIADSALHHALGANLVGAVDTFESRLPAGVSGNFVEGVLFHFWSLWQGVGV